VSLGNSGADVRVRTVKSLGTYANLDSYERAAEQQCPSWQSNSHRKSTMLIIMFAPGTLDAGVYYGTQHVAKLNPTWIAIRNAALIPAIVAARNGEKDAYTKAFASMLSGFDEVLKTSSVAAVPTTIVHNDAGDWSWFGKMMIIVALIIAATFGGVMLMRSREDKKDSMGVQSQTKRVRSGCLNRLLAISDPSKVDEMTSMVAAATSRLSASQTTEIQAHLLTFIDQGRAALAAFNRFDNVSKDDPNKDGLPVSVYRENQQAYEDIIASSIEPAEESLRNISELLKLAQVARVG
jgi:hypothetical protein